MTQILLELLLENIIQNEIETDECICKLKTKSPLVFQGELLGKSDDEFSFAVCNNSRREFAKHLFDTRIEAHLFFEEESCIAPSTHNSHKPLLYSYRSASIGETLAARRAG